jgi:membrane associated rhomboid family serine protease
VSEPESPKAEPEVTWSFTVTPPPEYDGEPPLDDEPAEEPSVDLWGAVGSERPWGTALLLFAWCAIFAAMGIAHDLGTIRGDLAWGALPMGPEGWSEPWRWLAYAGVHANVVHLASNAFTMIILGPAVERIFTRAHLAILFATGAIAGAWGTIAWHAYAHPGEHGVSLGASGAVFALGGALLSAAWRLRHRLAPSRWRALAASVLWLVIPGIASGFSKPEVGNAAHVAGFACGLGFGLLLGMDPRLGARPVTRASRLAGWVAGAALVACYVASFVRGES